MRPFGFMLLATTLLGLGAGDAVSQSAPAEEQRVVETMTRWIALRSSGDAHGAAVAASEAMRLIADLRPDFVAPPISPRAVVFDYVLELAARRQPGVRPKLEAAFAKLQLDDTKAVLHSVWQALEHYRMDRGGFPKSGARDLAAALTDPRMPYIQVPAGTINSAGELLDGWGRPLHYSLTDAGAPVVYSIGPNGRDEGGGGDDVVPPR